MLDSDTSSLPRKGDLFLIFFFPLQAPQIEEYPHPTLSWFGSGQGTAPRFSAIVANVVCFVTPRNTSEPVHGICIFADDTELEGAVDRPDGCSIIQWES